MDVRRPSQNMVQKEEEDGVDESGVKWGWRGVNRCDVCFAGFIGRTLTRHGYVWWENRGLLVQAEPFIAVSEGRAIY